MKFITPTRSRRLNEVVGLLFLAAALLLLISLSSYHFADRSWNTATAVARPLNLAGSLGSHVADLFLQVFGAAAFLFPLFAMLLAWRWVMSEEVDEPWARILGSVLLISAICAGVSLVPKWHLFGGLIPLGGAVGLILAELLLDALNTTGAVIAVGSALIVSTYLLTQFSLDHVKGITGPLTAPFRRMIAAFRNWRERTKQLALEKAAQRERAYEFAREQQARTAAAETLARATADEKIPPAKSSRVRKTSTVAEPVETLVYEEPGARTAPIAAAPLPPEIDEIPIRPIEDVAPWNTAEQDMAGKVLPVLTEVKAVTQFKLPSTDLLNPPQARSAYDEQELKNTAAAIKSKFEEFNVFGSVVQINPGPVVTTFEFKPEAGIKYSRITTLTEDLCLGLQAESILIERIPGKPTVGIEVPNVKSRGDQPAPDDRESTSSCNPARTLRSRWAKISTAASRWLRSKPCRTC